MGLTTTTAGRSKNTYDDENEYELVELGEALDNDSFTKVAVLDMDSLEEEREQDMNRDQDVKDETYNERLDKAYVGMLNNTRVPP